jgi:hypothetical protein
MNILNHTIRLEEIISEYDYIDIYLQNQNLLFEFQSDFRIFFNRSYYPFKNLIQNNYVGMVVLDLQKAFILTLLSIVFFYEGLECLVLSCLQ